MNEALTFDDVLLKPKWCPFESRKEVSTEVFLRHDWNFQTPIISANMDTVTGWEMAAKMAQLGGLGIIHRFMSIEDNVKEYQKAIQAGATYTSVGVSLGVNEGLERADALYDAGARIFCIDVAHGHSKLTGRMVRTIKEKYGDNILLIAGNVCTYAGADYLISKGADVIKVGIGPGSVCTTREKTGCG